MCLKYQYFTFDIQQQGYVDQSDLYNHGLYEFRASNYVLMSLSLMIAIECLYFYESKSDDEKFYSTLLLAYKFQNLKLSISRNSLFIHVPSSKKHAPLIVKRIVRI